MRAKQKVSATATSSLKSSTRVAAKSIPSEQSEPPMIDEESIYKEMFSAISEELYNPQGMSPNLDSMNFSENEIKTIRNNGIRSFIQIMQQRFSSSHSSEQVSRDNTTDLHFSESLLNDTTASIKQKKEFPILIQNEIVPGPIPHQPKMSFQLDETTANQSFSIQNPNNQSWMMNLSLTKSASSLPKSISELHSLTDIKVHRQKEIITMNQSYQSESRSSMMKGKEDVIDRLYRKNNDSKIRLKELQEVKQMQLNEQVKQKKYISQTSESILMNSSYSKPEERAIKQHKTIIEQREKLKQEHDANQIEKELAECSFKPSIISDNMPQTRTRTLQEFVDDQQNWLKNKNIKASKALEKKQQLEMKESTFHPKISKVSESIKREGKVEERLIQSQEAAVDNRIKLIQELTPSFKTPILKKSNQLAQARKQNYDTVLEQNQQELNMSHLKRLYMLATQLNQ